jgi:predicted secreted Zn-dependent protease
MNRLVAVLSLATVLPGATLARTSETSWPEPRVDHYSIRAATCATAMDRSQVPGDHGGYAMHGDEPAALTSYSAGYRASGWVAQEEEQRRGRSTVSVAEPPRVRVTLEEFVVLLPRWENVGQAATPRCRHTWDTFVRKLREHEQRHVRIVQDALPRLQAALDDAAAATMGLRAVGTSFREANDRLNVMIDRQLQTAFREQMDLLDADQEELDDREGILEMASPCCGKRGEPGPSRPAPRSASKSSAGSRRTAVAPRKRVGGRRAVAIRRRQR